MNMSASFLVGGPTFNGRSLPSPTTTVSSNLELNPTYLESKERSNGCIDDRFPSRLEFRVCPSQLYTQIKAPTTTVSSKLELNPTYLESKERSNGCIDDRFPLRLEFRVCPSQLYTQIKAPTTTVSSNLELNSTYLESKEKSVFRYDLSLESVPVSCIQR